MEIFYLIQDVKTQEYFWKYRIDEGFTANIEDATFFDNKVDALNEIQLEIFEDVFNNRIIEIKEYNKLKN